ncbi:hypothetical protein AB5I41_31130 [Sphingomonas sp. MMS24-JH45]
MKVPGLLNISGSANWANKADYGLTYHRARPDENRAELRVTKVRMGLPGKEGQRDRHVRPPQQHVPRGSGMMPRNDGICPREPLVDLRFENGWIARNRKPQGYDWKLGESARACLSLNGGSRMDSDANVPTLITYNRGSDGRHLLGIYLSP